MGKKDSFPSDTIYNGSTANIPAIKTGGAVVTFHGVNFDEFVKSQKSPVFVIPAKAGIQVNQSLLDSRLCGSDGLGDFLRDHQL